VTQQPEPAPEIDAQIGETFERSVADFSLRREAAMFKASGRTIHLLRAYYWARQMGADLAALPWFLEYLDRVVERLHQTEPQSDKEVVEIFEMDLKNRRPQYDHRRDDLARAVIAYRRDHPALRAQAFKKIAEQAGVSEAEVRHAYYFFPEEMRKC
jgi:hypothetical protein